MARVESRTRGVSSSSWRGGASMIRGCCGQAVAGMVVLSVCGVWVVQQGSVHWRMRRDYEQETNWSRRRVVGSPSLVEHAVPDQQQREKEWLDMLEEVRRLRGQVATLERRGAPLESWRVTTECSAYDLTCPTRLVFAGYALGNVSDGVQMSDWLQSRDGEAVSALETAILETERETDEARFWRAATESDSAAIQYAKTLSRDAEERARTGLAARSLDASLEIAFFPQQFGGNAFAAWTMTDSEYARDMLDDVVAMATDVAGFEWFVVVCLDRDTLRACLALGHRCAGAASAVAAASSSRNDGDLKSAVQNTKFYVSRWLVEHSLDFFFFEMDVWFLRPASLLPGVAGDLARGRRPQPDVDVDVAVASHQNNPTSTNIGVYAVVANNATREFFANCVEESEVHRPEAHDQRIVHNMLSYHRLIRSGKDPPKRSAWKDMPYVEPPRNPVSFIHIPPHIGTCSTHPVPTDWTVFVHTLGTAPLQHQHGKRIHAKELGVWHGGATGTHRRSYYPRPRAFSSLLDPTGQIQTAGSHGGRKYLALDGRALNAITICEKDGYHNARWVKAKLALLVTIAKATGRILLLPKIVADYHVYFSWTYLDLASLEGVCEYRETNFPSNPKAWVNATHPFDSVAQLSLRNDAIGIRRPYAAHSAPVWIRSRSASEPWTLLAHALQDTADAELLLFHDGIVNGNFVKVLANCRSLDKCERQHSRLVRLIRLVYLQLRFCGEAVNLDRPASKSFQGFDCYGRGTTS